MCHYNYTSSMISETKSNANYHYMHVVFLNRYSSRSLFYINYNSMYVDFFFVCSFLNSKHVIIMLLQSIINIDIYILYSLNN